MIAKKVIALVMLALILAASLVALWPLIVGREPQTSAEYLARADARRLSGDLEKALADCNQAMRLDQTNSEAFETRAWVYVDMGDFDDAISNYNAAIHIYPAAVTYYFRGVAFADKGDIDKAIADYTEAIRIDPKEAEASYLMRGFANRDNGNLDFAIDDFTSAIQLNPDYGPDFYSRAVAYEEIGDIENALRDLSEALKLGYEPHAGVKPARDLIRSIDGRDVRAKP